METQDVDQRTTLQIMSDWRERKLAERSPTVAERFLTYLLPTLWVLAFVAAGAAISW
jgi:hypothetical protein